MKIIFTIFFVVFFFSSYAENVNLDLRNQMLDNEIEKLTKQRDEKYLALQQCERSTKGFKIAGITTLVATGVGVYGNIKLAQKLNGTGTSSKTESFFEDTRTEEQKSSDDCAMFCADYPEDAVNLGCSC